MSVVDGSIPRDRPALHIWPNGRPAQDRGQNLDKHTEPIPFVASGFFPASQWIQTAYLAYLLRICAIFSVTINAPPRWDRLVDSVHHFDLSYWDDCGCHVKLKIVTARSGGKHTKWVGADGPNSASTSRNGEGTCVGKAHGNEPLI